MFSKNKIVQNAIAAKALNAKFKVGDMVRIAKGDAGGKTGKVVFASPYGMLKVDVDGKVYVVHEDGVTENAVAKNAKFKVGDRVKYYSPTEPGFNGSAGKVVSVGYGSHGNRYYVVFDNGEEDNVPEEKLVRNAAETACNAVDVERVASAEFRKQFKGRPSEAHISAELKPDGSFKIFEQLHGMSDVSGVDWKAIARKVQDELARAGYKGSVVRANPWNNGIEGNEGTISNSKVACNWKRSDIEAKITQVLNILVGISNLNATGAILDIDQQEKAAFSVIRKTINDMQSVLKTFSRERKD